MYVCFTRCTDKEKRLLVVRTNSMTTRPRTCAPPRVTALHAVHVVDLLRRLHALRSPPPSSPPMEISPPARGRCRPSCTPRPCRRRRARARRLRVALHTQSSPDSGALIHGRRPLLPLLIAPSLTAPGCTARRCSSALPGRPSTARSSPSARHSTCLRVKTERHESARQPPERGRAGSILDAPGT